MKKSLLITYDFPPVKGGVSHMLWQICNFFQPDKIVILTLPSKNFLNTKFTVYRKKLSAITKLIWPRWIFLFWHGWRIIKKENIKMVQVGQILPIGTVAWLYKKLFNIPYLAYVYGQDLVIVRDNKRKMKLIKLILKQADAVIACSLYAKKLAVSLGAEEKKTIVSYPCPNKSSKLLNNTDELETFKRKNNLKNRKILLSVGNLVTRKGQDRVINVLPEIIKKIPETLYLIIGEGSDKEKLTRRVVQLELYDHVKFLDQVSNEDLNYYYQICDAFVMLSRELKNQNGEVVDIEGFGMVFLEANLYGKPVIGGKSGGVPEAVEHNVSGLLVDPENKNDIVDSVIKLLSNTALANKLGEQGRTRVLNKFNAEKEVEKIKRFLYE
jgi:phosphatidylinositol alpha-1,6-mannosyltransferase